MQVIRALKLHPYCTLQVVVVVRVKMLPIYQQLEHQEFKLTLKVCLIITVVVVQVEQPKQPQVEMERTIRGLAEVHHHLASYLETAVKVL
jgi:hypothetical protein